MLYLVISSLLGVIFFKDLNVNFYIFLLLSLTSLLLFFKVNNRNYKIFLLALFIFLSSGLNMSLQSREIHNLENKTEGLYIVKKVENHNVILKSKGNKKKYSAFTKEKLNVGEVLSVSGDIKDFDASMNEYGYNQKNRKRSNGIYAKINISSLEKIKEPNKFRIFQKKLISHIEKVLDKNLNKRNSKLMKSIILANRNYIDDDINILFNEAGIAHILALSGLHISIIIGFFDFILGFINISKMKRRAFALFIVGIYIIVVGLPVGAIRAFIMSLCMYMAFVFKRKYSSLDALSFSFIVNLFINPYVIYSLSFIFSYMSVLSILIFYKRIKNYFSDNYLISSLVLTFSVSILLIPINLYYFYEFSFLSFISNLVLIPFFSLAIVLAFILIIFSFLGFLISPTLNILLNSAYFILNFINKFKYFNFKYYGFSPKDLVFYYVIMIIILNRNRLKDFLPLKNLIVFYLIFSTLFISYNSLLDSRNLNVNFLYVDQGDCTVIQYKNKNYLVDTGGHYSKKYNPGRIYTLNYLKRHNINNIDGLFISHYDLDHIEGIFDILDYINIKNVYVSYYEDNEILNELLKRNIKVFLLKEKDKINLSKDTYFGVITNADDFTNDNDKSMVLELSHKDKNILFTGDISESVEQDIKGKFNILKVSHHGSKSSTSDSFLKEIKASYGIISSGIDNRYNHPNSEVLNRLEDNGVDTYITARDGQINVKIDKNINVKTYVNRKKNYDFIYIILIGILSLGLMINRMRELWTTKIYIE